MIGQRLRPEQICDKQASTRAQNTERFVGRLSSRRAAFEVVEDEIGNDYIERIWLERQCGYIGRMQFNPVKDTFSRGVGARGLHRIP